MAQVVNGYMQWDLEESELGERVMWALALEVSCRGSEYLMKKLVLDPR